MQISESDAKGLLTELVRRATARLVAVHRASDAAERRTLMEELRTIGTRKAATGPDAARSQDDLYAEDGMPR